MEKSPSWSRAHDWKSCRLLKGLEGSNPSFSARKPAVRKDCGFFVFPMKFPFPVNVLISVLILLKICGIAPGPTGKAVVGPGGVDGDGPTYGSTDSHSAPAPGVGRISLVSLRSTRENLLSYPIAGRGLLSLGASPSAGTDYG